MVYRRGDEDESKLGLCADEAWRRRAKGVADWRAVSLLFDSLGTILTPNQVI